MHAVALGWWPCDLRLGLVTRDNQNDAMKCLHTSRQSPTAPFADMLPQTFASCSPPGPRAPLPPIHTHRLCLAGLPSCPTLESLLAQNSIPAPCTYLPPPPPSSTPDVGAVCCLSGSRDLDAQALEKLHSLSIATLLQPRSSSAPPPLAHLLRRVGRGAQWRKPAPQTRSAGQHLPSVTRPRARRAWPGSRRSSH